MEFDFQLFLFSLFIVENIVMVQLGSFPYKWGYPVAYRYFPSNKKEIILNKKYKKLIVKEDEQGNVYLRFKYPFFSWGPYVYAGQVEITEPTKLVIRMGPSAVILFITFILTGLFSGILATIVSIVTVCFFIVYYFNVLTKNYEEQILKVSNDEII